MSHHSYIAQINVYLLINAEYVQGMQNSSNNSEP